jgi:uncharacterized lipoprotein YajG
MKKILLLSVLLFCGCDNTPSNVEVAPLVKITKVRINSGDFEIISVTHDEHEYIVMKGYQKGGIIHSPNCSCLKGEHD